jgi:amidase
VTRIRARDPVLHAFVTTRLDEALVEAKARAQEPARSPLHGVPYSLKDYWDTAGLRTTGGSYRHRDRVPQASSPVHEVFQAAGAVLLGKTNLSDLALAPESASYVGGVCRNPHDLARSAGGSSGGAACAVADGMSAFDWGSDIGGSIRMPAAFCGILGLRLSSATWPLHGEFPSPPPSLLSMNGQGPIARTFDQLRALLAVAAPRLRTGQSRPFRLRGAFVYAPPPGREGAFTGFATEVGRALEGAVPEVRRDHGLVPLHEARNLASALWGSHFEDLLDCDTLRLGEGLGAVASALAFRGRFGDRRFHPRTAEVLLLIALGRLVLFRDRGRAVAGADAYRAAVSALWDQGYLLVAPTCLYPATRHGRSFFNWDLVSGAMPGNLADATALALPFGRFPDGLPRSIQVMGPPGSEDVVIDTGERIAGAFAASR